MVDTWNAWGPRFERYHITASVFALALFSPGFLLLHAHSVGVAFATTKWQVIVLFAAYGVFYSIGAAQM
jgi:hypothetical protein